MAPSRARVDRASSRECTATVEVRERCALFTARTRSMLDITHDPDNVAEVLRSYVPQRPRAGPMLVALGPRNGASVLRVARALTPRSDGGVLVATVLEPLPGMLYGADADTVAHDVEQARELGARTHLVERMRSYVDALPTWEHRVLFGD